MQMDNRWSAASLGAIAVTACLLALFAVQPAAGSDRHKAAFADPLDVPASRVAGVQKPDKQPLIAIASAGKRLVAVGFRGLVIVSDDGGRTWAQARVPVQVDLLSVVFVSAEKGWAAGHDGVILQTLDGGLNWQLQLDNRTAKTAFPAYYRKKIDEGDAAMQASLDQVVQNTQNDNSLPYLSLVFDNDRDGFAVGAFGVIATTDDGGRTWTPASHRIDNPQQLNLNAVRLIAGQLYIAAEQGLVFRYDRAQSRFVPVQTGYQGSFFDIAGNQDCVIAFGLRGTAYRSVDKGMSWTKVETATGTALYAGGFLKPASTAVLLTEGGDVLVSRDGGAVFAESGVRTRSHVAGALVRDSGEIVAVGYGGVSVTALDASQR